MLNRQIVRLNETTQSCSNFPASIIVILSDKGKSRAQRLLKAFKPIVVQFKNYFMYVVRVLSFIQNGRLFHTNYQSGFVNLEG
jgi:hypothetical protein